MLHAGMRGASAFFVARRGGIYPSRRACGCRELAGTHICVPYKHSGNGRRGGIYAARVVCGGGNLRGGIPPPAGSNGKRPGRDESLPYYSFPYAVAARSCPRNPSVRLRRPPPFDKGGFFLLAHFFIFFALLEYFSIILHKSVAFPVPIIL